MIIQREVYNFALGELLRTIEEAELEKALEPYLNKHDPKFLKTEEQRKKQEITGTEESDAWTDFLENIDKYAVETGIKDLAENHDHYLYGTPKQT